MAEIQVMIPKNLSDFEFSVPERLVAQKPLQQRSQSRMMVVNRNTRKIVHDKFQNLPAWLEENDLLVLNKSKVIKARFLGKRKNSGGKVEIFLLQKIEQGIYQALINATCAQKVGIQVDFSLGLSAEVLATTDDPMVYVVKFKTTGVELEQIMDFVGRIPLPPYIKRESDSGDFERYQTVYAKDFGSVAAPTAGLHFTDDIFSALKEKGVSWEFISLHVGLGTFLPIKCENLLDHKMHFEQFHISPEVKKKIFEWKNLTGGKITAVGTTSIRCLESVARGLEKETNLFLKPGDSFHIVDQLVTNFHQPKSSLIVLLCAFLGDYDLLRKIYEEAVREEYRFYSYGDCMLIQ